MADCAPPAASNIDDFELPKANIARIMKRVVRASGTIVYISPYNKQLPEGTSVQKEAKSAVGKAATVFINYLTAVSTDLAKTSGHKTISAANVLKALGEMEFDDFLPRIETILNKHRENQQSKKAAAKSSTAGDEEEEAPDNDDEDAEEADADGAFDASADNSMDGDEDEANDTEDDGDEKEDYNVNARSNNGSAKRQIGFDEESSNADTLLVENGSTIKRVKSMSDDEASLQGRQ